jgi:3-oxoacyl-[acyl-carrier protein] reductase
MNRIDLEGRVAVVTGGAQGIGLAITERFVASGARVVIWDIDGKAMDETVARFAKEHAGRSAAVSGLRVELTDDAAVAAATAKAVADAGRIDILVNNAGITGGNGTTWELDPQVWRRTIEVNLIGPYLTCRHVVPVMMKAANGKGGFGCGRIVNIASVAGKEGNPNASHYSASKAGVIALTKSLGKELATKGILVNAIAPAVAKTAMFAQMTQQHIDYMLGKIPMGRFVEVGEIAAMAAWLASDDCSFSTAAVFDITGGRSTY